MSSRNVKPAMTTSGGAGFSPRRLGMGCGEGQGPSPLEEQGFSPVTIAPRCSLLHRPPSSSNLLLRPPSSRLQPASSFPSRTPALEAPAESTSPPRRAASLLVDSAPGRAKLSTRGRCPPGQQYYITRGVSGEETFFVLFLGEGPKKRMKNFP